MKCPFCGAEMIEGWVQSPRSIIWEKDKKGAFSLVFASEEGVELANSLWSFAAVKGFNCQECKKIVIDYNKD